jgi:anti-anti-sigma factor
MTMAARWVTDVPIVILEGTIDDEAVSALQRQLHGALDGGKQGIVVDLGAATVLDARSASRLCAELRAPARRGAKLAVSGASGPIVRTLELCAIDGLELHPDITQAVSAVAATPA